MVALIQRVREASVEIEGAEVGRIGAGMLILFGAHRMDTEADLDWLVGKCARLRIFPDEEGRMNRSIRDAGGEALVVSQFTLYGDARRGNRPSFVDAAPPEQAEALYDAFVQRLSAQLDSPVRTGVFGAMMEVRLANDGPVTLWVERRRGEKS